MGCSTEGIVRRLLRENATIVREMDAAIERSDEKRVANLRRELDNNERQQEKWRGR